MMLVSGEDFMLFLGIPRPGFEVLLHSFDSVWWRRRKRFYSTIWARVLSSSSEMFLERCDELVKDVLDLRVATSFPIVQRYR
jgi:hypothetical protein